MKTSEKVRENRARRQAERLGLRLMKSYRRDPRAYDYNGWMVVNAFTNLVIYGHQPRDYAASLADVEKFLKGYRA